MDIYCIKSFCFVAFLLPAAMTLNVNDVVNIALVEVASVAPDELQQLHENPQLIDSFLSNLTAFVEKDICFENALTKSSITLTTQKNGAEDLLAQCYPPRRIEMMKHGLKKVTYRLNFVESKGGQMVRFTRYGRELFSPIAIRTKADIKQLSDLQIASIVVEAVDLVLQVVGISVHLKDEEIDKIVHDVIDVIDDNLDDLNTVLEDFENAPDAKGKATAIFNLLKLLYNKGLLWTIIRDICSDMKWYQWLAAVATITTTLIAALFTDGAALIVKIALALNGAIHFGLKFASMAYLTKIEPYLDQ